MSGRKMLMVGPARPGSTPFYKTADGLHFDGQKGRMIDWGHTFDRDRGYRVFFKFRDSPASNTWGPESLLKWCEQLAADDDDLRLLKRTAATLAGQCVTLNCEWERLGKPANGVPTDPAGSA